MSTAATADTLATIPVTTLNEKLVGLTDSLPEWLQPIWQLMSAHPLIKFLFIIVVAYAAAVLARSALSRLLKRVAQTSLVSVNQSVLIDLRRPIFISVFFFGLAIAVAVSDVPFGGALLVNILMSIITASWMTAAFRISTRMLDVFSMESRYKFVETRTVPIFDLTSKLFIIMLGSYILLMIWGINPAGWLASAGIAGLAIGFAAKDTLANLFSGFFIVADAPYKIGDYIYLDSGERGKVSAIGLRSTRLLTRDDVEITIPNGVIANAKIINESSGSENLRIRVIVGVAYGSDVDQVTELLMSVGKAHPEVCKAPECKVRLRGFGASSLDFNLMCWILNPEDRGRIIHELNMTIYKLFIEHHIEIPYTKQDLYIKEWPNTGE